MTLKVTDLSKRYKQEMALKRFSAEFLPNAVNVVIGYSGSGKTTLFNCISGLEPFDNGTISWNNDVMLEAGGAKLAKPEEIGYVLQGFSLFSHLTILDNLTLAPKLVLAENKKQAEERAIALLEKMQIADKKNAYPNQLSGGQQQRVAIARAMMMHPKVLMLDEPTNALDPQLIHALEKMLKTLAQEGLTLLVSTHHLEFAKRVADQSFFVSKGELIETSAKADLLIRPSHPEIQKFIQEEEQ